MKVFSSIIFIGVLMVLISTAGSVQAQKLKVEEIIDKHLESIGKSDKRSSLNNLLAIGLSEFESKLPSKSTGGRAVIASDAKNFMFLTSFNSQEYPYEKIGYFNEKISLPWVTAGTRSPLGAFIADHEKVLSDGLFTGAMSKAWVLLHDYKKTGRVRAGGRSGDKESYIVEYMPRGGSSAELSIKLFFDEKTFRHTRTEYFRRINPAQDTFGQLGRQGGGVWRLVEEFSDFKDAGGLMLPHHYKASYLTESNSGAYEYFWTVKVSEYRMNQELKADFFKF